VVAVYDQLTGIETQTSAGMVRYIASEAAGIIRAMGGMNPPWLPGYPVKVLDGNGIEGTDHRLQVLREMKAGALPGKALVVFDPETDLASDVFPCEDAYVQERALLDQVLETVQPMEVWIADRNFCVQDFLQGIHEKGAYFVIRQHQKMPYQSWSDAGFVGNSETGAVFEHPVQLRSSDGKTYRARRMVIRLNNPTRDGAKEIAIFTNLLREVADALNIAELYRKRWGIETAFQRLEKYFHSEINTLGYPKAASFGFCLALVAFNGYAVVMAA
jgi:IS4 transposase